MRRRLSVLVVLILLVVAGLAVPASAGEAGCRAFGQGRVAGTALQGPNEISDIATAFRGDLPVLVIDLFKGIDC